jgi:hypothetical protein
VTGKSFTRTGTALIVLAFLALTAAPSGSSTPAPAESGTFRLLRTIKFKDPVVDCHGSHAFDCVETSTVPESFDLSAASGPLDVSMTLTITYRTTAHDAASVVATMKPVVSDKLMSPGRLPLRPSSHATTTTIRWTNRGAPPDLYRLGFQIEHSSASKLPMKIWASKVTVVIEAWVGGAP